MRFYAMGNYYLSSIQQGIQALHVLGEMVAKYSEFMSDTSTQVLYGWMHNHKTVVCLNGGDSHDLRELWLLLSDPRNTYLPVAKFNEDQVSLDGALTCVGIVLPERLYDAEWVNHPDGGFWFDSTAFNGVGSHIEGWEAELLDVIKKLPLAR